MVDFFLKSKQISKLFLDEFEFKIDFRKTRKKFLLFILIDLIYLACLIYLFLVRIASLDDLAKAFSFIFWVSKVIFINFAIFRFHFYVSIVAFHLKEIEHLMQKASMIEKSRKVSRKNSDAKKVLVIRKVYLLIKEMAEIVNNTMSFLVLLRLLIFVSNVILVGFMVLRNLRNAITNLKPAIGKTQESQSDI